MPEQHRLLKFNGLNLHCRIEGANNNKTVVLLHGLYQNLSIWDSMTLRLLHNYRVVSIDLPGHGFTSIYNGDCHSMNFIALCVNEVLTQLGIGDCVIIGHSWGGYVAMAYTEQYPHSIKGIGLISSVATADDQMQKNARQEVCQRVREQYPNYVMEYVPTLFSQYSRTTRAREIDDLIDEAVKKIDKAAIIAAETGMIRRPSYVDLISNLQKPMMFIYGKQDLSIPLEVAITMASIPAYSELLLLDNVAHMPHIEAPVAVVRTIGNFIETCYSNPLV